MNCRTMSPMISLKHVILYSIFIISLIIILVQSCRVDICSREYSMVLQMSQSQPPVKSGRYCSLLHAYQRCIRSIAKSCRGHLEFHTIQTLLKNWRYNGNCTGSGGIGGNDNGGFTRNRNFVTTNHRRSGSTSQRHNHHQTEPHQQRILQQQQRLQQCLSAAYNYTINKDSDSDNTRIRDERIKLIPTSKEEFKDIEGEDITDKMTAFAIAKRRRSRSKSDDDVNSPVMGVPLIDDDDVNDDIDEGDDDESDATDDNSESVNKVIETDVSSSTQSSSSSPIPPSPPLTCIIYGDPHLRTFNNHYQTCKCNGAWPLIDHPLFAVQITNSRLKGSSPQITGVSKVTVLVRQFTRCGIHNDLLYEAESGTNQGMESLPSSFIDGSTSTSNNLIRITSSSNNNVVTIHLYHICVRVYIGQFSSSNYLNVVIKFRSATSTVKQQLVLNSISANSLCKVGCPIRERIDIKNILTATGVNVETVTPKDVNDVEEFVDTRAMLANDASTDKMDTDDPCKGLYGYYRISCLYDVAMKGIKDVNNACRFAQSFDEMRSVYPIQYDTDKENVVVKKLNKSHASSQYNLSFTFFIIIFFLSSSLLSIFYSFISF